MDAQDRQHPTDLKKLFAEKGRGMPFVQLIRLLRLLVQKQSDKPLDDDQLFKYIRVRPELSLNFPGRDVNALAQVGRDSDTNIGRYRVTATFLGLYGASSPLPTFYTEDLLDEQREDQSIAREFLDVINNPFYALFFKVWKKKSLSLRYAEDPDDPVSDILFSLLGLGENIFRDALPDSKRFLHYIGLTSQHPRSAEGLRVMLSDMVREPDVQVQQCVSTRTDIPADQRCRLGIQGNALGETCYVGTWVAERMGKFRVEFGPLDADRFQRLLPDQPNRALVNESVRFYLDQPLDWDLLLVLPGQYLQTARLGQSQWGRLGWDTWLFAENNAPAEGRVLLRGNC